MTFDRRNLLKAGLCGLPFLSLQSTLRAMHAGINGMPNSNKRMLTIFLRGGNDGLNTIIPHGDQVAYEAKRPTIFYGPAGSGATYQSIPCPHYQQVGLHPSLALLSQPLQNLDLAVIHRVGNTVNP
jgi:uncharacterized protein (DUF1501 family)